MYPASFRWNHFSAGISCGRFSPSASKTTCWTSRIVGPSGRWRMHPLYAIHWRSCLFPLVSAPIAPVPVSDSKVARFVMVVFRGFSILRPAMTYRAIREESSPILTRSLERRPQALLESPWKSISPLYRRLIGSYDTPGTHNIILDIITTSINPLNDAPVYPGCPAQLSALTSACCIPCPLSPVPARSLMYPLPLLRGPFERPVGQPVNPSNGGLGFILLLIRTNPNEPNPGV